MNERGWSGPGHHLKELSFFFLSELRPFGVLLHLSSMLYGCVCVMGVARGQLAEVAGYYIVGIHQEFQLGRAHIHAVLMAAINPYQCFLSSQSSIYVHR